MQISTKLFNQQTLERLSDMHGTIQHHQARIATGKNILRASDDPIAAVNISVAKEQKTENARYIENIGRAKSKLELSENALAQASNLITRIYELSILAENDTFSRADRTAMKLEVTQLKDSMFQIVNSEDASGQALFAGYQVNQNAFFKDENGYIQYMGDRGNNYINISENMTLSLGIDGASAFLRVPSENSHKSIFGIIEAIEDNFEDANFPKNAISDLQGAIDHLSLKQTYIGAQLNKAELQEEVLNKRQIILSENLSALEDADITKIVTELQTMLLNRDAATQAFAKIGQQSLFDYLR
jgi:flagellar hook-associated protein 3 FlgL